ncbi:MAG: hypothetical protein GX769_04280 [Erysipelothrix sp.]|nr:hypothetical protein [Erysipelothrix sp.]
MNNEFVTIILIVLLLVYMIITRYKMYKAFKENLQLAQQRKDMTEMFTGQMFVMVYILVMVLSVIAGIVVYINKLKFDDPLSWLLVFAIIFVSVLVDLVRVKVMYTTNYNDHGMYVNTDYIRYNSIKDYKQKKLAITTELITFNNQSYIVPTKTLRILKDKIIAKQKK